MRILTVLTGEMCFDGITVSVLNAFGAMDRSGVQMDVVSARATHPEMKRRFEELGCRVYPLENRTSDPVRYVLRLMQLIRRGQYDILHAHGSSATLAVETTAALLAGCRVRIVHSRNSFCEHTGADRLLRPLMQATCTHRFACGERAGKWLFGDRPFTIIRNGKDIDRFLFRPDVRKRMREALGVSDDTVLLGHVGLFHRQKNHPFLIETFEAVCKRSDRYRLALIGEGQERPCVERLVREKGLEDRVILLGNRSDVDALLQAMDLMVFPSLFEGMPNVVLEWQLAGLPALISDTITRECDLTGSVSYLPLEKGPAYWAEQILMAPPTDRLHSRERIRRRFTEAGFDLAQSAAGLRKAYLDAMENAK